jgi:hypothetical protein
MEVAGLSSCQIGRFAFDGHRCLISLLESQAHHVARTIRGDLRLGRSVESPTLCLAGSGQRKGRVPQCDPWR